MPGPILEYELIQILPFKRDVESKEALVGLLQ
jgi:hypothetical protein